MSDALWRIEFDRVAVRALKKLDFSIARRVLKSLDDLSRLEDPAARCKALTGPYTGLWRIRVGDYRTILDIRRGELVIIALDIGNRATIYD
ncbi:type II toxin-antitoxin system RelE family toxin [Subtercola boreus]|uniref:type II toxin-antitoxin system RelE family toxin n=1 Tax=Subtercola boreus TaxID=120213 RepID=UPI00209C2C27|nr:type II toxin-antitoxin system RelE/ParE family toxin [Subtercola boreus]